MVKEIVLEVVPSSNKKRNEAARRLERRGFRVVAQGEDSISVTGSVSMIEKTFHKKLVKKKRPARLAATMKLTIPPDMVDVIKEVILPVPPEYFP